MRSKKPFYRHTSILLAIAFTAGVGVGGLSDSLKTEHVQDSVLGRSPFIRSLSKRVSIDNIGKILAYEVFNGDVVEDKVGDDTSAPDTPKLVPITPVPPVETPVNAAPTFNYTISCDYTPAAKPTYIATPLVESQSISLAAGGSLQVTIAYKNDGNTPWFSDSSGCKNTPVLQLGTTHETDRASIFSDNTPGSGWADTNRIFMTTPRVDPGQSALFTFNIVAPSQEDVYRETFAIVIPGMKWVAGSDAGLGITVGHPYEDSVAQKKLFYINGSGSGQSIDVNAPKSVEVDLSSQKAILKLGDYTVRTFSVSTGGPQHPTPIGTWSILFKQQVRIGGTAPYYIMPKWQAIRSDGYGFHSLPSLGNAALRAKIRALGDDEAVPNEWFENDTMWTEALDHIGSARSHGCVRFLPDDAAYVFDFTEVGTPVTVHR